jgi:hypothetical protein
MASAALFLLVLSHAAAQDLMPQDERAEALRRRYLLAGRVFPLTSFPLSRAELRAAEHVAGGEGEPDHGGSNEIEVKTGLEAAFSLGLRSADLAIDDRSAPMNGIDLRRRWLEEDPLLRFGGSLLNGRGLELAIEAQLKRERGASWASWNNLPGEGTATNPVPIENHLFTRGIIAWDSESLMASFGRDKIHLGSGQGSSFLASKELPYLDSFRLRAPIGHWSLDWVIATMDNEKAKQDVDIDYLDLDGDGDRTERIDEFANGRFGFEADENPSMIFYNVHRAQWAGDRLRLAVAGQVMLARRNNSFQLVDFFPISTWHNADVLPNNMCLVLDGSWAVFPGLAVNFSAGLDDFSAKSVGLGDTTVPTIDAYLFSVEYALDDGGFSLDAYLEAGYTHYLWGNFDGYATMRDDRDFLAKMIARYKSDSGEILLPLTSPYGPGALWAELRIGARHERMPLGLGLEVLVLSKNTEADLVTTAFKDDEAVAKAPRRLAVDAGLVATLPLQGVGFLGEGLLRARPSLRFSDSATAAILDVSFRWRFGALHGR